MIKPHLGVIVPVSGGFLDLVRILQSLVTSAAIPHLPFHVQHGRDMKRLTFGVLGAAVVAATVILVRRSRLGGSMGAGTIRVGEAVPSTISLEELRSLGI